jgi:hypothetical protein
MKKKKGYFKMPIFGGFMLFLNHPNHPLALKMKPNYEDMDSYYLACMLETQF